MDINLLFKAGDNACGRVLRLLPEKEIGSPKKFMMDVLETETLPSINDLHPKIYRTVLTTDTLIPINRADMTGYIGYRIPLELTQGLKIRGIRSLSTGTMGFSNDVYRDSQTTGYIGASSWLAAAPNRFGRYSSANLYETALGSMVSYVDLQLLGQFQEAPIPRFEPPNIMWLNKTYASSKSFFVVLLLENDKNLLSVDDEVYEAVKKLFILDLKKTIYNNYGMISNVDTAIGSLDLRIDDWSGASDQRDDLFTEYDSMSHIRKTSIISG